MIRNLHFNVSTDWSIATPTGDVNLTSCGPVSREFARLDCVVKGELCNHARIFCIFTSNDRNKHGWGRRAFLVDCTELCYSSPAVAVLSTDDRQLLITLGVQLCVQLDALLGVRHRVAQSLGVTWNLYEYQAELSLNSTGAVSPWHLRSNFVANVTRTSLTCNEEIMRVGRVRRGCYEDASDLSATSRACRARELWRTTRHTDKRAALHHNQVSASQAERGSRPTRATSS